MTLTNAELDEMADLVHDLEILLEELPMILFLLKVGLHQGQARLRTEEAAASLIREVEALDIALEAS